MNLTNNITEVDSMINFSLTPYQSRYKYYNVPIPENITGQIDVSARLLFRPFKPSFIIEHHPEFLTNMPIFEVDTILNTIEVQE